MAVLEAGEADMVVLQENTKTMSREHFAFGVEEVDIEAAPIVLQQPGVAVKGPDFHEWMPASIEQDPVSAPASPQIQLYAVRRILWQTGHCKKRSFMTLADLFVAIFFSERLS